MFCTAALTDLVTVISDISVRSILSGRFFLGINIRDMLVRTVNLGSRKPGFEFC
jgi:hypothetical protein